LRDLVDFFPASLAGIVSYFSAEITRGIWPNVAMNGVDWPNPDKSLHLVETEVKDILARAGVHIQNCYPRKYIFCIEILFWFTIKKSVFMPSSIEIVCFFYN
jgi:hypothetical protein